MIQSQSREGKDDPVSRENLSFYYNNLGLAFYHCGQNDEAEKYYNLAEKENRHNAEIYFNRGNVALANQKWKEAQADFKKAIDQEPDNPKLYHARGLGY